MCIWGTIYFENQKIELLILVKKQPFFSVKYFFKNDEQPKKTVGEMCVYGEAYIRHVTLSNCQCGQIKIWLKT
ncbi:MAG: hypothetical protein [Bacteriophage sp.]|nr:MAG: hypothetical protein [Bacteriophage sp.]